MPPTVPSADTNVPFSQSLERLDDDDTTFPVLPVTQPIANAVIVDLRTSVLIPDFSLYYNGPIQSFVPPYHALSDGSLVATPFISDVRSANLVLVLLSASVMFFFINLCTAIQYLRRTRIRKMALFYLLLASQLLGVTAMLALMSTYFDQFTNCNA